MIAEVAAHQPNCLIQQPTCCPKKRTTTRNMASLRKEKASVISTSSQKATSKAVKEKHDARVACPLPPKDANTKHGAQEKPKLYATSSKCKHTIGGSPRQVSIGSEDEPLVKSGSSLSPRASEKDSKVECDYLRHVQEGLKIVQEDVPMERLKKLMLKSDETQLKLQERDKLQGLPKSHSQTMVNTSRSRRQLREGIIIPKWDGTPLINGETELGRPKKRKRKEKHQDEPSGKTCKSQSIGKRVKTISQ
jgi:hypothetical protein